MNWKAPTDRPPRPAKEKIMADFVEASRLEQVPPGKGMCFTVADEEVAIINVDGTIYAMKGSCLHKGASLGTGELDGKVVTCRAPRLALKREARSVRQAAVSPHTPPKVIDGKILIAVT
jgi:3-phenylpropionate/trans-cinnamate dioxygenase ferredoxin subunit